MATFGNFADGPGSDTGDDDQGFTGGTPSVPGGGGFAGMGGIGGHGGLGGGISDVDEEQAKAMLVDYNAKFKDAEPVLFRDAVIQQLAGVLISRRKSNALLVGPAGVGKTALAEELARRIANNDPSVPPMLRDRTIMELPLANMVAGSSLVGQLEAKVQAVIDYAVKPENKVVLFIDEIHMLVDDRTATYDKIGQLLKPAMARGDLKLIGSTTMQEARGFDKDPALRRRFDDVIVDELTVDQTVEVLRAARGPYQKHYQNMVAISEDMLPTVVALADRFARAGSHRPDNALTLMDRTMASMVVKSNAAASVATASGSPSAALAAGLNAQPHRPVTEVLLKATAQRMLYGHAGSGGFDATLFDQATDHIKGQAVALAAARDYAERDGLGLFPKVRPTSMLLIGPSGVGKTELARAMAQALTGEDPIMLSMTEFTESSSTARILGSSAGYIGSDSKQELPFDALSSNPRRLVLIDEIEKAHPEVRRLFMSVLDEGSLRMASGKLISFKEAIVVATTNAGREELAKAERPTGFASATPRQLSDPALRQVLKNHFEEEFIGRFGRLITFRTLTAADHIEIVADVYARVRAQVVAEQPDYAPALPQDPDPAFVDTVRASTDPSVGARPVAKAVHEHVQGLVLAHLRAKAAADAAFYGHPAPADA